MTRYHGDPHKGLRRETSGRPVNAKREHAAKLRRDERRAYIAEVVYVEALQEAERALIATVCEDFKPRAHELIQRALEKSRAALAVWRKEREPGA